MVYLDNTTSAQTINIPRNEVLSGSSKKGVSSNDMNKIIFYTTADYWDIEPKKTPSADWELADNSRYGIMIFKEPLTAITTSMFDSEDENTNLQQIVLPDSIQLIDEFAFYESIYMQYFTVPKNVKEIGEEAFRYCKTLNRILAYPTTAPSLGKNVFNGLPSNGVIYILRNLDKSVYSSWLSALPSGWTIENNL